MHRKNALKVWGEESQAQHEMGARANSTSVEANHCSLAHEDCCMSDRHIVASSEPYVTDPFANQTPQKRDLRPPDDEQQIQVDSWPPNQGMSFASLASKQGMSPNNRCSALIDASRHTEEAE